ncbi:hypothetical protein TSAR_003006 [Trichomalopsis sarcophagae]|uniref:Pre-C2HC domain-containing protein n=1 Tax=Trichomalopsis sarcophagae TaxID=543379 RepID=A0A232F3F4_9HYME|nr:hypothetical protein TSAR_003006 [Trichomalopsis sarcophagae]
MEHSGETAATNIDNAAWCDPKKTIPHRNAQKKVTEIEVKNQYSVLNLTENATVSGVPTQNDKALSDGQISNSRALTTHKKIRIPPGLNNEYSSDEIKTELSRLSINEVQIEKVDKLMFNKDSSNKFQFLVQITAESKAQNLTALKNLVHQRIKWEPYRKHKVFQFYNCQRVGHFKANYNLGYRCRMLISQKVATDIKDKRNRIHLTKPTLGGTRAQRDATLPTAARPNSNPPQFNDQRHYASQFPAMPRTQHGPAWPLRPTTQLQPSSAGLNEDIKSMLTSFKSDIIHILQEQNKSMIDFIISIITNCKRYSLLKRDATQGGGTGIQVKSNINFLWEEAITPEIILNRNA